MRVVLDANVLVGALITKGTPPARVRSSSMSCVDLIVSGDKKHMLALQEADGIATARQAMEFLGER